MALILNYRPGMRIFIGHEIELRFSEFGNKVTIEAPPNVTIRRNDMKKDQNGKDIKEIKK